MTEIEAEAQALVVSAPAPVIVRTLVAGKADIQAYATSVLEEARQEVLRWETSLIEATRACEVALSAGEQEQFWRWKGQRTRRTNRLARARKFLLAIEAGYLPIPRIPTQRLSWTDKLDSCRSARGPGGGQRAWR